MKALTVKQPFASWIADGSKTIEVRSWPTSYRGPVLITASANPAKCKDGEKILPAGCLICIVDVVDCRPAEYEDIEPARCEPFAEDFCWVLANPRPVQQTPVKGKLNLWSYDGEVKEL